MGEQWCGGKLSALVEADGVLIEGIRDGKEKGREGDEPRLLASSKLNLQRMSPLPLSFTAMYKPHAKAIATQKATLFPCQSPRQTSVVADLCRLRRRQTEELHMAVDPATSKNHTQFLFLQIPHSGFSCKSPVTWRTKES